MILQIHFVCGFVFTLVTGVSWFFASYLDMILQIVFVCGFVFRGITILCELSLLHWFIFISTVCFSLCIVFKCLFCVVSQFKSFFTGSPGVLFSPWIIFMYCLLLSVVLLIEFYFTGFTCIVLLSMNGIHLCFTWVYVFSMKSLHMSTFTPHVLQVYLAWIYNIKFCWIQLIWVIGDWRFVNLYFSRSLNIGYSLTLLLLQSLQVFSN